jgi:hypothetical protein
MPRTLKTTAKGKYRVWLGSNTTHDIYPENDSLSGAFFVGYPVDFYLDKVDLADTLTNTSTGYAFNFNAGSRGYESTQNKVDVRCEISRKGTIWHSEDISIKLDTSSYKTFAFLKKFKPLFTGEYQLKAFVKHPNDVLRSNDTFTKKIWVLVGKDALVTDVKNISESEIKYQPTSLDTLKLIVQNQGVDNMTNVQVFAKVFRKGKSIFENFTSVDLNASEQKTVEFLTALGSLDTATYKIVAYTSSLDDQNIFNDSLVRIFYVKRTSDLRLIMLDSPSVNEQYKTNLSMRPRVLLMNTGQDSIIRDIKMDLKIRVQGNSTPVYETQMSLKELMPQQDATVFAMQDFTPSQQGAYEFEVFAVNNVDLWPANDTLRGNFNVTVNAISQLNNPIKYLVYPNPVRNGNLVLKTDVQLTDLIITDVLGRNLVFSVNGFDRFGGWDIGVEGDLQELNNDADKSNQSTIWLKTISPNKEMKIKIHSIEKSGVVYLKLISENGSVSVPLILEMN